MVLVGLALGAVRCSSDSNPRSAHGGGSGGAPGESPRDKFELDFGDSGAAGGSGPALHPLCDPGDTTSCLPDDDSGCTGGLAGASGEGGSAGASNENLGGAAGSGGVVQDKDLWACHLSGTPGEPVRVCAEAGSGELDAPCLSPANCAPGLTCVGEGPSGLCRPYCCQGDRACDAGTYCAPRRVVGASEALMAPVCVRADQCKLSEEYPCPEGATCQCATGTACVPVRADGTTSCVVPGKKKKGEACDGPFSCSYGHVCSSSLGCLELCSTVSARSQCSEGEFCQALSGFPDDVGLCIVLRESR